MNHLDDSMFSELYNQPEYKNRQQLPDSDYYVIAHLNPNKFIDIAYPENNNEDETLRKITVEDSRKIVKLKQNMYIDLKDRWFKGFVYMRKRIVGHMLFAASAQLSISMIMFDNKQEHKDTIDFSPGALPLFDDNISYKEVISRAHNASDIANQTLKLSENDALLDKAIILSGEAILSWFNAEASFFSAWRSIETIAKRYYKLKEQNKGTPYNEINSKWCNGGTRRRCVENTLRNNGVSFNKKELDKYYELRNSIGHGSVDIDSELNMQRMENETFASISDLTLKIIRISRKLIFNCMTSKNQTEINKNPIINETK